MFDRSLLSPPALTVFDALEQAHLLTYGPGSLGQSADLFRPEFLADGTAVAELNMFGGWIAQTRRRGYPDIRAGVVGCIAYSIAPIVTNFPAAVRSRFEQLLREYLGLGDSTRPGSGVAGTR